MCIRDSNTIRQYRSTVLLVVLLLVASVISLFIGVIELPLQELLSGNLHLWEIFLVSRLPRLLAILCTGVGTVSYTHLEGPFHRKRHGKRHCQGIGSCALYVGGAGDRRGDHKGIYLSLIHIWNPVYWPQYIFKMASGIYFLIKALPAAAARAASRSSGSCLKAARAEASARYRLKSAGGGGTSLP